MQEINIRAYQVGDAENIFKLFQQYSPYKRDGAFWVWINRVLSHSIISVAELNGEIVGHYAILPRTCRLKNGDILSAGQGIHAFVEPKHRNIVSIFSISSFAYKLAKEQGIQFVYGFPNSNYRLIQERIERWKKVELFKALVKTPVNTGSSLMVDWKKVDEKEYDDLFEINDLFEKRELKYNFFKSDAEFWFKRYFSHPQKLYEIWKLNKNDLGIGFVVLKFFEFEGIIRLHIIDFLLNDNYKLTDILPDIEMKFRDVKEMVFWPFNMEISKELKEYGFADEGFDTYFGVKIIDKSMDSALILNFRDWHLTMGDSDAF